MGRRREERERTAAVDEAKEGVDADIGGRIEMGCPCITVSFVVGGTGGNGDDEDDKEEDDDSNS